jgi:hypothetical protein
MTVEIVQFRRIPTHYGPRELAGTGTCPHACWLLVDPEEVQCGHCEQLIRGWRDGSLVGFHVTCEDGVLTLRLVDFDVVLHRCGEDDTVLAAVDQVIELAGTRQAVPA